MHSSVSNLNSNKKEDISYSLCLERKYAKDNINDPLKCTLLRKIHKWVEDENVKSCYNCHTEFSLFIRKHHCRLCGRIFCYECSKYRDTIPEALLSDDSKRIGWGEYLKSYMMKIDLTQKRVCIFCHKLIERINIVKKLIEVFRIIKLDIKDIKTIGSVCQLWNYVSNYYLSLFRDIQYKLPVNDYNDFEKEILWNNYKYFSGHNRYFVHLLKICNTEEEILKVIDIIKQKKSVNCWSLMCSRNCQPIVTTFDSINLLVHYFRHNKNIKFLKQFILSNLVCGDNEFKNYLPFLVYYAKYDEDLTNYLINRCLKNFRLLNSLYWELQYYISTNMELESSAYEIILEKLKEVCTNKKNEQKFVRLTQGTVCINLIKDLVSDICENNKKYEEIKDKYKITNNLILPCDPQIRITKFYIDKIKIKDSATKPIIIPCLTMDNKIYKIMYKRENIRKDQIVMNIINLIEMIVNKEENLNLNLVTYNILPIDSKSGIVEIVDNCDTIYFIKEKIRSSILNYILEHNSSLTIKEVREKFIKTTAAYCVITYLLGIGDRHLDNIIITRDGRLFHIDFDYILGRDPVFNNPGIRITSEIVEAIGGLNSNQYIYFKDLCTKIYNCLRRNIDIFMNILLIIPKISDLKLSENEIKQQIIKRFIPGETYIDAEFHLVNQLEKRSYTDKIKDWCHYHTKEKTISSTLIKLANVLSNLRQQSLLNSNKSNKKIENDNNE